MSVKICPFNPTGKCIDCMALYQSEGKNRCRLLGNIKVDEKVTAEKAI